MSAALRTLRAVTRGPWIAMLAVEGRVRAGGLALPAQADFAGWIAGNALAACGRWVRRDRALDAALVGDGAIAVGDGDATTVLAVLAAAPALPVAASLSRRARAVLRLLGIPMIDIGAADIDHVGHLGAGGVRLLVGDPAFAPGPVIPLAVTGDATGFNVGLGRAMDARALAACD
jgi:hypothetical protein